MLLSSLPDIILIYDGGLVYRAFVLTLLMSLLILMRILSVLLIQVRVLVFQLDKSSIGIFVSLALLGLRVLLRLCGRWAYIDLYRHVLRVHV